MLLPFEFVETKVIVYVPLAVKLIAGALAVELENCTPPGLEDQLKVGAGFEVVVFAGEIVTVGPQRLDDTVNEVTGVLVPDSVAPVYFQMLV
jgi:hypothetical protein